MEYMEKGKLPLCLEEMNKIFEKSAEEYFNSPISLEMYFMTKMTQEEFEEKSKHVKKVDDYEFNKIITKT